VPGFGCAGELAGVGVAFDEATPSSVVRSFETPAREVYERREQHEERDRDGEETQAASALTRGRVAANEFGRRGRGRHVVAARAAAPASLPADSPHEGHGSCVIGCVW
jgi:hypothetical protein